MFWIDELSDPAIWKIGDEIAGAARNRAAVARADFGKNGALAVGLTIEPESNSRHAELCGWPAEKDARIAVAQELCAKSQLRLRSDQTGTA